MIILVWAMFNTISVSQGQTKDVKSNIGGEDSARIAGILARASILMLARDKADSAGILYRQVLQESHKLHYNAGISKSLKGIAGLYFYRTEYDTALLYLNRALAYSKELPYRYTAQIRMQVGAILINRGDYKAAMNYFMNTLNRLDSSERKLRGHIFQNIASIQLRLNRPAQALTYLEKAEQYATAPESDYVRAIIYLKKAEIFSMQEYREKHFSQSYYYLNKVIDLAKQRKWLILEEGALMRLASNYIYKKDYNKALELVKEATRLNANNQAASVKRLILKGRCYAGLHAYREAEAAYLQAEKAAEDQGRYYLLEIYALLADLYKQQSRYKPALAYTELYQKAKDTMNGDRVRDSIAQLQFRYETAEKDKQIYKNALFINRQQSVIQRKSLINYGILAGVGLLGLAAVIAYKYNRKIQRHRSLEAIWKAKMSGEETERSRLARELHDHIGASLFAVKMSLNKISKREQSPELTEDINEAMQLLDQSLKEVRNTAHNLMPEFLLRYSLDEALRVYCNNMQDTSGIKIEYQFFGTLENMEQGVKLIIYRTVQELIANSLKHAEATFILVQLSSHNSMVSLTVEDNGRGMDPDLLESTPGMGLAGIRESIDFLKGSFSLYSEKGKGTTVYIEIGNPQT